MQRNDVASAQEQFQRRDSSRASLLEIVIRDVWIDRCNAHSEHPREPGDPPSDFAESDDAEAVVAELVASGAILAIPDSLHELARVCRYSARERNHEPDHQLGDGIGVRAGKIEDGDSALASRHVIDVVSAARTLRDEGEPRRAIDHPPRDAIE